MKIIIPSLPEQRRIVAHLDRLQVKVDEVKRLQAETEIEIAALFPSILNKTFMVA
jgi:restriction endonuclease S subunit